MPVDRAAAETFIWSAARLLDRHRYAMLFEDGPAEPVIEALRGYRNADGGFGHALEPDLRCPGSQPAPTLYALEILHEAGAADGDLARAHAPGSPRSPGPDGGIPFALPGFERLPARAVVDGRARFLPDVRAGRGLPRGRRDRRRMARARHRLVLALDRGRRAAGGYWLKFALRLPRRRARRGARARGHRLARRPRRSVGRRAGRRRGRRDAAPPRSLPSSGSRSRELVTEEQIEAHLDAVQSEQHEDGGWMFDWLAWSPAQTADWRGIVTIRALRWLRDNGRRL